MPKSFFAHISLGTADLGRSLHFYDAVLAPLGWARTVSLSDMAAYGEGDSHYLWIGLVAKRIAPTEGMHVAFDASTRANVAAFHAAGLAAGGRDNGAPGLRPHYHPDYYAAFLIDPDGHHVEAVTFAAD
jgi:catechol 2,3-dioxygenase-like lactoylglutathione lyase family enzyme